MVLARQVVPIDYEAEISQRLLQAVSSGDSSSALDFVKTPFANVNCLGAVTLKSRRCDVVLRGELPSEVLVEYEEFMADVTPLFLAVHFGNLFLVRKFLSLGADVNQKSFRGFATTAAAREGHHEILEILVKAGASQPACEEALLEACYHGWAKMVDLLMASDLIRPNVAVHALAIASFRGFVEVADTLMKCGVDIDANARLLLQSSTPTLHTNIDCPSLVAAIIGRQASVVRLLLKAGARKDAKVKVGAWSWDLSTGEEFRVGGGLAEPYDIAWCAVEYFEATGAILRLLLQYFSVDYPFLGRTLLHHAILCGNVGAVKLLLNSGANVECPIKAEKAEFRPLHMAARLDLPEIVRCLIDAGCELNASTNCFDTALMICSDYNNGECLKVLAMAGADFGLLNNAGQSALSLAESNGWSVGFQNCLLDVVKKGVIPRSSNYMIFNCLIYLARTGNTEAMQVLISSSEIDLDHQDDKGFSAVMYTAVLGHVEAFRLLVYAGANVKLSNRDGQTVISLSEVNDKRDLFEKVMFEFALEKGNRSAGVFRAMHYAARLGDFDAVRLLTNWGYDVNIPDSSDYTPLMLAARENHGAVCEFLISHGANCQYENARGETPLSLARKHAGPESCSATVLLDELARVVVLRGSRVQKHTKNGKGSPHAKELVMLGDTGILRWGKSDRRNVVCLDAVVGPSSAFEKNSRAKGNANSPGLFHVLTSKNKEFHFVCEGGTETAELWVRGINRMRLRV